MFRREQHTNLEGKNHSRFIKEDSQSTEQEQLELYAEACCAIIGGGAEDIEQHDDDVVASNLTEIQKFKAVYEKILDPIGQKYH